MKSLPTQEDFGDMVDLDIATAWKRFGNKTLEEAYNLFDTNPLCYQEDLMWMGDKAFVFYFPIALRFILSENAKGACDAVSSIATMLEFRFEYGAAGIKEVFPDIRSLCDYVISHYELFDINAEIYGDVKGKYVALKQLAI
ncbi:MAG: hypothetical protein LV481_09855 [Methylacidiphilales bacterium]|nr:hypothetical protein [Candidatus Methylacidiphilales bacterium]